MAEAPTIVFVVGPADGGGERALPATLQAGSAGLARVPEATLLAGAADLQGALLAVLDGAVAEPARVRDAIRRAAPLCVVVSLGAGGSAEGVAPVDEVSLGPLVALASAAALRAGVERAVLNQLNAGYTMLDESGRSVVSSALPDQLGLRRDGSPTSVLDDDMPDSADTPSRRLRVGWSAGEGVVDRKVLTLPGMDDKSVIIHADVTERARLEQRILAIGRAEASSQLARGVVHDLNNAFCVIASFTDLLLEELDPDDARHDDVLEIARAGAKASALTGKLVGFSRGGPARVDAVNLADAVRRAEPLMRRVIGEESELALALGTTEATAVCDMLELESVVTGLAGRARRALDGRSGVVTVAVADEPPWVTIRVSAAATDDRPDELVDPDGGVEVDAATTFAARFGGRFEDGILQLPKAARRPPAQRVPRAKTTERGPETVLVLDDEASVRLAVKRVLSSLGYRVLEARRGADAAPLVEGCDLVIADLVLPGERGLDVVRSFRAARPSLPALILTGYADEEEAAASGFTVMSKPFDAAELARRVRQTIDAR